MARMAAVGVPSPGCGPIAEPGLFILMGLTCVALRRFVYEDLKCSNFVDHE